MLATILIFLVAVSLSTQQEPFDEEPESCPVELNIIEKAREQYSSLQESNAQLMDLKLEIHNEMQHLFGKVEGLTAGQKVLLPENGGTLFTNHGKSYFFSHSPLFSDNNLQLDWQTSQTWCENHGMKLALFETDKEWQDVSNKLRTLSTISKNNYFWVGAQWKSAGNLRTARSLGIVKRDEFRWNSGRQLSDDVTMPDEAGGECIVANIGIKSDHYYASRCDRKFAFMCEY